MFVTKFSAGTGGPVLTLSPLYTPMLWLRNVGGQPLTLNNITTSSSLILERGTCGSSLPPGTGCQLIVSRADILHYAGGTVTISSNAPESPQSFPILLPTDLQYYPSLFLISQNAVEFPAQLVGTSSRSQPLTITNLSANPETIDQLGIVTPSGSGANPGDFTQTNNCPTTMVPGESCTMNVEYAPTAGADGVGEAQITIATDSLLSLAVGLMGVRSNQSIVASGGSNQLGRYTNQALQFGTLYVGSATLPRVVSLTNVSQQGVTLTGFTVTGPFSQTNNCAGTLAPQASCRVAVSFVPTGNGNFTGSVTVANGGQGGATVINLAGTGLIPSQLGVSPLSLSFGSVIVGDAGSQPLTLTNLGSTTATLTQFDLSANFSQTNNCGGSLAPGASCTVTVSFAPTALTDYSGTMSIEFVGAGSPQIISLSGSGATALEIMFQSLSFGNQEVGTESPPQVEEMGNAGPSPVTISSVSITGDFELVSNNCLTTLAPGRDCTLGVVFKPTVAGSENGTITVTASDTLGTHVISLSGTGVIHPFVSLSPASLSFADQLVSSASAAQSVTVTNTGAAPLNISSIVISTQFSQTNTCATPIDVNGACSISVTFVPTVGGTSTGTLTLVDDALDSPQSVPLAGTGQDFSLAPASGSSTYAAVGPGQSATYALSMAALGGLSGSVNLTCTGAPAEATCLVNPSTASLSASSTAQVTVTVNTTAASGVGGTPQLGAGPRRWLWIWGLLAAVGCWLMIRRRTASRLAWAPLMVVVLALMLWGACGGGGVNSVTHNAGTPVGTYHLNVTGTYTSGASTLQHNLALMLTVH
jgi:hypothetical protein